MRELSLNVMDIAQNSITAGAGLITIKVHEKKLQDRMIISIIDNGKGMTDEQVSNVIDPFYTTRTTRSVGLGVPLFKMEAEMTGGSFSIDSEVGKGTNLTATFVTSSVDMVPLGDINSVISLLATCNPELEFVFERTNEDKTIRSFTFDTREIKEVLGEDVPLNSPDVVVWINEFLKENTDEILSSDEG